MARRGRIGDFYRIPLPNGRWGYCQHVYRVESFGDVVRVFVFITAEPLDSTDGLEPARLLFPTVFVGLVAAREGKSMALDREQSS